MMSIWGWIADLILAALLAGTLVMSDQARPGAGGGASRPCGFRGADHQPRVRDQFGQAGHSGAAQRGRPGRRTDRTAFRGRRQTGDGPVVPDRCGQPRQPAPGRRAAGGRGATFAAGFECVQRPPMPRANARPTFGHPAAIKRADCGSWSALPNGAASVPKAWSYDRRIWLLRRGRTWCRCWANRDAAFVAMEG